MTVPEPSFAHLRRLTDVGGLYEHARGTSIRREHGYCLDDVARGLVVTCREPGGALDDLREQYLVFVLAAQHTDGSFRNRRDAVLRWSTPPGVEDCWGRALWGLGTAIGREAPNPLRSRAMVAFELGAAQRSPWPRAMAFAALGAAEVLRVQPGHQPARALLAAAVPVIGRLRPDPEWPWPEPRLSYANAALPEALLAAGCALDAPLIVADGLTLLGWLLKSQTRDGRLSVVPASGRARGEDGPGFDQQPIEVAALADACARAFALTGEREWAEGARLAVDWFLGANDAAIPLIDLDSGGGCDGLERHGRNENQGAESTLALLSTLQRARELAANAR